MATLTGDLKRHQQNEQQFNQQTLNTLISKRATVKLKKKLDEEKAKLTLKSSCFKLIVHTTHHRISSTISSLTTSFNNLANLTNTTLSPAALSPSSVNGSSSTSSSSLSVLGTSSSGSGRDTSQLKDEHFVFLFTSDYERLEWLEEINGAIYACKL